MENTIQEQIEAKIEKLNSNLEFLYAKVGKNQQQIYKISEQNKIISEMISEKQSEVNQLTDELIELNQ
jgi:predicted nuclease with TOPRIM domain